MPSARAVKELAAVQTQPRNDVLEIGRARGGRPERGRIERPAAEREQSQPNNAASDLEATIGDVVVRYPVTRQVQRRPQSQRSDPRAGQRSERTARRNMKRDDHDPRST